MGAGASSSEKYGGTAAKVSAVSAFAGGGLQSGHESQPQPQPELKQEPEPEPEPEPITAPQVQPERPRNSAGENTRPPEEAVVAEEEQVQNLPDGITAADRARARARARQVDLLEAAMRDVTSTVPRESKCQPTHAL